MNELRPDKKNIQFKVGITVFMALILLFLGYGWLTDYFSHGKYTEIRVLFQDVNRLDPGDDVLIYGMKRGRVRAMQLIDNGVLVTLLVELEYDLPEDTGFVIRESNLMGSKAVEIRPGLSLRKMDFSQVQTGTAAPGLTQTVALAADLVPSVESLLYSLDNLVTKTKKMFASVDTVFMGNQQKIAEIVNNTNEITNEISLLLQENKETISETISKAYELAGDIDNNMQSVNSLISELHELASLMQEKESTFGRIMHDDELYENLQNMISSADSLLKDIKTNPRRYLKMSIF